MPNEPTRPTFAVSTLLSELRRFESDARAAEFAGTASAVRAAEDRAVARLVALFADRGATLVDDRPPPFPSVRDRVTIYETLNGVWRGYTVEVAFADERFERFPELAAELSDWRVRFVHWSGFTDDDATSIDSLIELDADYVLRRFRPRAGFQHDGFRYDPAPVRAALDEIERRRNGAVASTAP